MLQNLVTRAFGVAWRPPGAKKAKACTPQFHAALKDAMESGIDIPITQGVLHSTANDHFGLEKERRRC
jgi:branched-chain amino acid transport system substrate-binding protein